MRSKAGPERETFLNRKVALLLSSVLPVKAEFEERQAGSRKQIDICVDLDGTVIAIEAEINSRRGALQDAHQRLIQAACSEVNVQFAVALSYARHTTESELRIESEVEVALRPELTADERERARRGKNVDLPNVSFQKSGVGGLAELILQIPAQAGNPEKQVRHLETALEFAAMNLSEREQICLAAELDLPIRQKKTDRLKSATKRGLLVVAAASMFHARLTALLPSMRPERDARTVNSKNPEGSMFKGNWPPKTLLECLDSDDPTSALYDAWGLILAIDYRPIFESGRRALKVLSASPNSAQAVKRVARAGARTAMSKASRGHDLVGRIFHRLLESARCDGSFYTSTAGAVLLAGIALGDDDLPRKPEERKIIDPACGTGTLLMAVMERTLRLRHGDTEQLSAKLVEDSIYGLDVNLTACHMAATTLGVISPSTSFRHMNIHMMPFGVVLDDGSHHDGQTKRQDVRIGSLELLASGSKHNQLSAIPWSAGQQVDSELDISIEPNSLT